MNRELHIVGFRVGRETYGVPITALREIVRVPEITAVPDAPEHVEGVINLRGKIIPIVDLRKRLGFEGKSYDKSTRIIVIELDGMVLGFIVDSVSEVLRISDSTVEPPPSLVAGVESDYIEGVGKLNNRLLILLELKKIFSASDRKELEKAANN